MLTFLFETRDRKYYFHFLEELSNVIREFLRNFEHGDSGEEEWKTDKREIDSSFL